MKFKADEISSVLQREIEQYRSHLEVTEVGRVIEVGDGIARVWGLENAVAGELLEFPRGVTGMALNLEKENVGCVFWVKGT
jgi:F-type H+-transporting ATPase subunit alpha